MGKLDCQLDRTETQLGNCGTHVCGVVPDTGWWVSKLGLKIHSDCWRYHPLHLEGLGREQKWTLYTCPLVAF